MAAPSSNLTLHRYKCTNQGYTEDLGDGVTLTLMLIPAGKFMMGASEDDSEGRDSERPQHLVQIPQEFLMGQTPVTQAQYEAVMGTNPATEYGENFVAPDKPVVGVSWYDAVEFCQKLSDRTGKNYHLPSEAEWEYACRAGTETAYHFGDEIATELANYAREVGHTSVVRAYPPNQWGLYDMHGNVLEWCQDNWHGSYAEKSKELKDNGHQPWLSEEESTYVLRGGSWNYYPRVLSLRDTATGTTFPTTATTTLSVFGYVVRPPGHSALPFYPLALCSDNFLQLNELLQKNRSHLQTRLLGLSLSTTAVGFILRSKLGHKFFARKAHKHGELLSVALGVKLSKMLDYCPQLSIQLTEARSENALQSNPYPLGALCNTFLDAYPLDTGNNGMFLFKSIAASPGAYRRRVRSNRLTD